MTSRDLIVGVDTSTTACKPLFANLTVGTIEVTALGAVVFLASPASDRVTGHTLVIDGGWTAV